MKTSSHRQEDRRACADGGDPYLRTEKLHVFIDVVQ